ncbi:MAG: adenosylcobinamide-GDP ribazoletransferase [Alphaproteobacteria bacterium]
MPETDTETDRPEPTNILTGWWDDFRIVLTGWWDDFRIAASFLTLLPTGKSAAKGAQEKGALARAARGFPLAGLAVGLAGALVYAIADGLNLPPAIASLMAISAMISITGALHEDGLADFADAVLSAGTKTEKLKIMRDSGIGAYGTLTLVITLGLRVAAIAIIAEAGAAAAALIATAVASRAALPAMMHRMKLARRSGLAVAAGRPDQNQAILAAVLGAAVALLFLGPLTGIVALVIGALGVLKIAYFAQRSIGGYTGDVLGAAQQLMETGMLLAIVALG